MQSRIKGNYSSQYRIRKSTLAITFIIMASMCSYIFMGNAFHEEQVIIQDNNEPILKTSAGIIPDMFYCYKNITIDYNKVNGTEDLENFPVLISLLDEDLHDFTQPNGDDIAFYQGSTFLDHEIELFNQNYSGTHAQLIAWVRIPSLYTTQDTEITMYFCNSTMTSQENPTGVWDANFQGVWHLGEEPGDTGYDSTSNGFHATQSGDPTSQEGKMGNAYYFDGIDDVFDSEKKASELGIGGSNPKTASAWVNTSSFNDGGIFDIGNYGLGHDREEYCLRTRGTVNDWRVQLWGDGNDINFTYDSLNKWVFFTQSYDGSIARLYADGVEIANNTLLLNTTDVVAVRMGLYHDALYFNGTIDEMRISNISRSAEWIATEYSNQYNPDSFYSVGSLFESVPPSTTISINTANPSFLNGTDLITLSPVDHYRGSGINSTSYRVNGSTWIKYNSPFELSNGSYSDGNYSIDYYSVDNDNHTELFNTHEFYLDKTLPTCSIDYIYWQTPGHANSSTLFTINTIESGSGIDKIYYKVDDLPWEEYSEAFNLYGHNSGEHVIKYYCVDKVGNKGTLEYEDVIYGITILSEPPPDVTVTLVVSLLFGVIIGSLFVGLIARKKNKSSNIKIMSPKRKVDKFGSIYKSPPDSLMSLVSRSINNIVSKYGDEIGVRFYSNPKIYPYSQKSTDGLILNDQGILHERITHSKSGGVELARELNLNPKIVRQVKALQIIYTNDISERNIMDKCETYHLPDTILAIVGLTWPQYQYERTFDFYNSKNYDGIVKIISLELFTDLLELKNEQKKQIEHVLELYNESNVDALKELSVSSAVSIHDSSDLRDYLKSKGLIIETFQDFFIPSEKTSVIIHVNIHVTCPTCNKAKQIEIPKGLINESKPVNTISIPKYLVCDHHFQAFVDKNLDVRGYQKVDIDLE